MELFTATGKLKKFFYNYVGACVASRVTRVAQIENLYF
jgi:Uri superfamily endonuclease